MCISLYVWSYIMFYIMVITYEGGIYGVWNESHYLTQHTGRKMIWYLALLGPCTSSYASSLFPSSTFSNLVQSFKT